MGSLPDYFIKGLSFVEDFIVPAAIIGLQLTPAGPATAAATVAVKVFQAAPNIMATAQRTDLDGPTKKLFAMATGKALAETISSVSGGGQKETWDKISNAFDNLIEKSILAIKLQKDEQTAGG